MFAIGLNKYKQARAFSPAYQNVLVQPNISTVLTHCCLDGYVGLSEVRIDQLVSIIPKATKSYTCDLSRELDIPYHASLAANFPPEATNGTATKTPPGPN